MRNTDGHSHYERGAALSEAAITVVLIMVVSILAVEKVGREANAAACRASAEVGAIAESDACDKRASNEETLGGGVHNNGGAPPIPPSNTGAAASGNGGDAGGNGGSGGSEICVGGVCTHDPDPVVGPPTEEVPPEPTPNPGGW